MPRNLALTDRRAEPLRLDQDGPAVERDEPVNLFLHATGFVSYRERFSDTQPIHLEQIVQHRFKGKATLLGIGNGGEGREPCPQRRPTIPLLLLGFGRLAAAPCGLQPMTLLGLLHTGKRVSDVHVLADVADQSLGL